MTNEGLVTMYARLAVSVALIALMGCAPGARGGTCTTAPSCLAEGRSIAADVESRSGSLAQATKAAEAFEQACRFGEQEGCTKAIAFFRAPAPLVMDRMTGVELSAEAREYGEPPVRSEARADALQTLLVDLRFAAAKRADTETAFRAFLALHPGSRHEQQARDALEERELARAMSEAKAGASVRPLLVFAKGHAKSPRALVALGACEVQGQGREIAAEVLSLAEASERSETSTLIVAAARERVCGLRFEEARAGALDTASSMPLADLGRGMSKLGDQLEGISRDCRGTSLEARWSEKVGDVLFGYVERVAARVQVREVGELVALATVYLTVAEASVGPTSERARTQAARLMLDAAKRDDSTRTVVRYLDRFGETHRAAARDVFAELILTRGKDVDGSDCKRFVDAFPDAPELPRVRARCAAIRSREEVERRREEAEARRQAEEERRRPPAPRAAGRSSSPSQSAACIRCHNAALTAMCLQQGIPPQHDMCRQIVESHCYVDCH